MMDKRGIPHGSRRRQSGTSTRQRNHNSPHHANGGEPERFTNKPVTTHGRDSFPAWVGAAHGRKLKIFNLVQGVSVWCNIGNAERWLVMLHPHACNADEK
jgi:hypothetical protein